MRVGISVIDIQIYGLLIGFCSLIQSSLLFQSMPQLDPYGMIRIILFQMLDIGTGRTQPILGVTTLIAPSAIVHLTLRIKNLTKHVPLLPTLACPPLRHFLDHDKRLVVEYSAMLPCTSAPGITVFNRLHGQLPFHLISEFYNQTSIIIITNLAFSEWPPY